MSQLHDYRDLLDQLKPLLPEYLRQHGRVTDKKGFFKCINPEHKDKNPSAHIIPNSDNRSFKCFACGAKGDIFIAANLLEARPIKGKDFLPETVFGLAKSFGIPYREFKLSDDDQRSSDISRAYDMAASVIAFSDESSPAEDLYSWNLDLIREVEPHIGTVSWEDFAKKMRELGDYTQAYLSEIGIKASLIDEHLLTFAIKNHSGRVVGFFARAVKTGNATRTHRNTSGDVPIFNKSELLYGLDIARHESGPLYLVEGQADVIELRSRGLRNVAGYMGSGVTEGQLDLLERLKRTDLILVPDWDKNGAGETNTLRTLDELLFKRGAFSVRIKELPSKDKHKSYDPRDFVVEHGLEEFFKLQELDAFDWRMTKVDNKLSQEEVCQAIVPIIVEERDPLRRETMMRALSIKTTYPVDAIHEAIENKLEEKKARTKQLAEAQVRRLKEQMNETKVKDMPDVLRMAARKIEEVQDVRFRKGLHGVEETRAFVQDLRREFSNRGDTLPGYATGYEELDSHLGGIPRKECMLSFAGDGNVGKSALVQNIGLRVAERNDDVCVLLFTIDDTRSQVLPRLVSQLTGIPINTVCQPERYGLTPAQTKSINKGWDTIEKLMRGGRFDLKDASHSATISFAEGWIDHVRNQYPERNILFILDNFHRLRGVPGSGERERLEAASDAIFMLTKTKGITAICTMELRKRESPSSRPRIEDLKGSKRFEYDNSVIVMMHNPMHSKLQYDANKDAWTDRDGVPKPVLNAFFDKNKVTSFKGMIPFRFRTETSQILSRYDDSRQFVRGSGAGTAGQIPD